MIAAAGEAGGSDHSRFIVFPAPAPPGIAVMRSASRLFAVIRG
jgi:hypothetical protein